MDEWISVDDALPTETGSYLVCVCEPIGENGDTTSFVLNAWYDTTVYPYSHDIGWTLLNEFYEFTGRIRERITHWMPFPEPPKEDHNGKEKDALPKPGVAPEQERLGVPRGKWQRTSPITIPVCSVCGEHAIGYHAFDWWKTDFCPHCGADLREKKESEETK